MEKRAFFEQVRTLNTNYPGGLEQYVRNARQLLEASAKGENALEGWSPTVPTTGFNLEVGSEEYLEYERLGLEEVVHCCFVIPAGYIYIYIYNEYIYIYIYICTYRNVTPYAPSISRFRL